MESTMPRARKAEEADTLSRKPPLDENQEQEQSYRTGQVSEGELDLARSVAKRMGWTPKEDWKRDPAKWVDAPDFLEQTPRELESLKERNRRTAQAASDAIEETQRRARAEAEDRVRLAEPPDERVAAARDYAAASGPHPETLAWMGRNAWFNDDPDARNMAATEINRSAQAVLSIPEQLAAAEAKVKRRFPEYFGQAEQREGPREVRLSDPRPVAPAVQPGNRNGSTQQQVKEKGFGDVPTGDQAQFRKYFARKFEDAAKTEAARQGKLITPP